MKKRIGKVGEVSWFIGNILCALGTCLASKSGFGVASIVAPAFVIQIQLGALSDIFTVGICEYIIQGLLLLLCCLIIGKFKAKFFFTICNILFYGACFDIWNILLAGLNAHTDIVSRILFAIVGTVITGLAVAIMLRTYIPPSSYEIFVKEVAESKGINASKMKLFFDGSMLVIAIVLMLLLFRRFIFSIIGPLTVISAFMNSVLIAFFGKIIDKYFEFTPAIPKLYRILNPNTNEK